MRRSEDNLSKASNPINNLYAVMRRQGAKLNPPAVQIGQVISPPPDLVIKIGDLQIDKDNILLADYLNEGYQRTESLASTAATGQTTDGTISSIGFDNGTMIYKTNLQVNDLVAVIATYDKQIYIVLCKVVDLNG